MQVEKPVAIHKGIQIPNDWKIQTIEDCCNILDSKRIPLNSEERKKMAGDIPYYGANGVQGYINKHIFDQDLILLAEDGGYFNEYRTRPIAYYVQGKSWVNNHAHVLTNKQGFELKWIFYSLVHKNIQPWIKGSTRVKLNQNELRKIVIPIPPMAEQQKIASIISKVDKLIQKTDQIIEQTQRVKKGLMQKLLTKGIGHTKFKKISSFFGKYLEIPEEWDVVQLGDFARVRYGLSQPPEEDKDGIPMIRATNIKRGIIYTKAILRIKAASIPKAKDVYLHHGDIIVVRSGAYTGDIGYISKRFDGSVAGYDLIVSPTKQIDSIWLANYLLSTTIQDYFSQLKSRVAQSHLNAEQLSNTQIYLPPISEQQKIANIISVIDNKIQVEVDQKLKQETLKKGLMQKILTGKIRVKV